jgi:hypothetical protein
LQYLQLMNFKHLLSVFSVGGIWLQSYIKNKNKNRKFIVKYQLKSKSSSAQTARINNYLINISLIGYDLLQSLHSFQFTASDYLRLQWIAVATPLIDDLMDKNNDLFSLVNFDKNENKLLDEAIQNLQNNKTKYLDWEVSIQRLIIAQNTSQIQKSKNIDSKILQNVAFEKGAASMLLLRNMIDLEYAMGEEALIAQLGVMIQFMDDLTDVYFDREEYTHTMVTDCLDPNLLHTEYLLQWKKLIETVDNSIFPESQKQKFKKLAALFFARGLVSIYQLEETNTKYAADFITNATRQELVVDMAKWKYRKLLYNAWKEMNY